MKEVSLAVALKDGKDCDGKNVEESMFWVGRENTHSAVRPAL